MDMIHNHTPSLEKTYVLGFSGGKDSVATWLFLTRVLNLRVICVFADTGHESDIVYDYLTLLEEKHGLELVRVQATLGELADEKEMAVWKICSRMDLVESPVVLQQLKQLDESARNTKSLKEKSAINKMGAELFTSFEPVGWRDEPLTMERLAILKRRFPSGTRRFCTTFLKLMPQRNWLIRWMATLDARELSNVVRCSGVRAQESAKRAKHNPWKFDEYMGCWMWLPVFSMSHEEMFDLHKQFDVEPCPLYKMGFARVGCFPCINSTKASLGIMARTGNRLVQLNGMEKRVAEATGKPAMSFFSNDKTPERFHNHFCENTGKSFPDALAVAKWATANDPDPNQMNLFTEDDNEDSHSCSSIYGLCE